jgi:hypothetical protein
MKLDVVLALFPAPSNLDRRVFMSKKQSSTKVEGNVIGRVGQRGDEGKAAPSGGSNHVGAKWGWIPAPAGQKGKHHPMGHQDGTDGSGSKDSGKGNKHGHTYNRFAEDTRTNGKGGPSK